MANPNEPDMNQSQFFLTLDGCEWLNKHDLREGGGQHYLQPAAHGRRGH